MTTYIVSLRGAQTGTFADVHQLATALAGAVKEIEQVPDIPMFRKNTAAFVHELPAAAISNVDADSNYVRIQVLTNAGALDRDKQRAVVARLTSIVSDAAGDPSLSDRTWVLLTEAPEGGWACTAQLTPTPTWWQPGAQRSDTDQLLTPAEPAVADAARPPPTVGTGRRPPSFGPLTVPDSTRASGFQHKELFG